MSAFVPRGAHLRRLSSRSWPGPRRVGQLSAHSAWRGLVSLYNSDDPTHAAAIAYYALLSLFPFLLLLMSVLGFVSSSVEARAATLSFVLRYFPTRMDFVASQLEALQRTRVPLGVVGGLALIWAALGFFSAVTSAVNHAWKVEKQRGYLKQKLVAFLMLVAACGLLALTMMLFSAAQVVGAHWFFEMAADIHA